MKIRVLSWNVRRAKSDSLVWDIISQAKPDVLTLQEVITVPNSIKDIYSIHLRKAASKNGNKQIFSTAILVKGEISKDLPLRSEFEWVNRELEFFNGNLLSCVVKIKGLFSINVVSVYSPAWPVDNEKLKNIDVSYVKLKQNPDVWCTEILWSALKNISDLKIENWIVAGDFNSSVTFDYLWKGGPRGNQEIIDRMNSIGFTECLNRYTGKLTPTFRNPKGGKIIHQLDHMYVTDRLLSSLTKSYAGDSFEVFEKSISDHLPIISDFYLKINENEKLLTTKNKRH